ncbi:hypothetical protein BH18THE2_BH18THE2_13130 [soil metagenome]
MIFGGRTIYGIAATNVVLAGVSLMDSVRHLL